MPKWNFYWELKSNFFEIRNQAVVLKDFYDKSDSKIKPGTYGSLNFYSLLFCYDAAKKGIDSLTDEQIKQYFSELENMNGKIPITCREIPPND